MSKTKKEKRTHIISIILWLLSTLAVVFLTYQIYNSNVLPSKYYIILVGIIIFLFTIFLLFISKKKTKNWVLVFFDIIFVAVLAFCSFATLKLNDVMKFMKENLGAKYETNIYYVLVNADSTYKTANDIKDKTIKLVNDLGDKETLERNIKRKVKSNLEYVDDISELLYQIETNRELILICNSGNYDAMLENDDLLKSGVKFNEKTRILETIEIKYKVVNEDTGIDVTQDPFVVYLSGIDTRSGKLPAKSLSDVNIIMAVNPQTHNVLMVHTPRDFYVSLHGKNGNPDKLTHAGLIGGVKLSMATIEDLYNIDLSYYVRVNFNAVVKLVDAIDGITINSDQNKTFTCHTDPNCRIKPGNQKVNGACALAFARERYAYKTGDRHRGENQEQVITKVIEKVTSSKTLLMNSTDLLNALNGTFQTNLTTDEITSLVKMQIDEMSGWTINTFNATGTDAYALTYSYPSRELYVMKPDMNSVKDAKKKLDEVLKMNN